MFWRAFLNYLAGTSGWKVPGHVTARLATGCCFSILNKYSGHLQTRAPAININNFGLVAIYWPNAQLACKTKLHYPKQGNHIHTLHWETSLLNPPSPAQALVSNTN